MQVSLDAVKANLICGKDTLKEDYKSSVFFFWNCFAGLCGSRSNQKYPVCRKFKSAGNICLWFLKRLRLCEKRMDHTGRRASFPAYSAGTCRKTGKNI